MATSRVLASAALTCVAALAAGGIHPASAASNAYVALGDSYSAGVGTRAKVDACYRSQLGYPVLLARAKGLALDYKACSGATTADVQNNQLGTLSSTTAYVTMTIGGNDVGFADVLTECAKPAWMSNCQAKIDGGLAILRNQMPTRYDNLYGLVRSKAPNARVVVAGYPRLFNGEDCNALTWFSPQEQTSLNAATDQLDTLLLTKAANRGFKTVDVRAAFDTHRVCDSVEWVNGLSYPIEESYHPNVAGNQGYAAALSPTLVGSAMRVSAAATTQRSGKLAAPQIDLLSAESMAGARKVGISIDELRRLDRELRSGDSTRMTNAGRRIGQLDAYATAKLGR